MRLNVSYNSKVNRQKGYFLPLKMQINIYPHKVLRYFQKNLLTGKRPRPSPLPAGGIPTNFGSLSIYKGETNEN